MVHCCQMESCAIKTKGWVMKSFSFLQNDIVPKVSLGIWCKPHVVARCTPLQKCSYMLHWCRPQQLWMVCLQTKSTSDWSKSANVRICRINKGLSYLILTLFGNVKKNATWIKKMENDKYWSGLWQLHKEVENFFSVSITSINVSDFKQINSGS